MQNFEDLLMSPITSSVRNSAQFGLNEAEAKELAKTSTIEVQAQLIAELESANLEKEHLIFEKEILLNEMRKELLICRNKLSLGNGERKLSESGENVKQMFAKLSMNKQRFEDRVHELESILATKSGSAREAMETADTMKKEIDGLRMEIGQQKYQFKLSSKTLTESEKLIKENIIQLNDLNEFHNEVFGILLSSLMCGALTVDEQTKITFICKNKIIVLASNGAKIEKSYNKDFKAIKSGKGFQLKSIKEDITADFVFADTDKLLPGRSNLWMDALMKAGFDN